MNNIIIEDYKYILNSCKDLNKLKDKNILVTGAGGFLASYLVKFLLYINDIKNYNIKVFALVRNLDKAEKTFAEVKNNNNLVFIVNDVSDFIMVEDKINIIIHSASYGSPKFYGIDPVGVQNANVLGTINMLKFALKNKIESFLFFSSGEVYGNVDENEIPINENVNGILDHTLVRSCYGESKKMSENICICWNYQYGIPIKIVRPFHTYGPGMSLDDGRVFADFVADILNSRNIVMKSDGKDKRAFCYIADATLGFLKVLLNGKEGEIYNVGCDVETSIDELATILVSIFPEKNLTITKDIPLDFGNYIRSDIRRSIPNVDKLKQLGWSFKYNVKDGFKRTIQSYMT